ncbi:Two component system, signal transduction histidine kinase [Acididesulfobacillus acetoxydans]|uniref:histidine kinase n=1 Tax=Acididesulfobacillus acetoxydans TaxID=1561005 RepID=A0A8S0Y273_9FIRM|nr:ATP-binding protein [Acididesulfobacillus acetoxydans]CAA7600405.1 Two component system, signal transduction histidine kinase [Acididesulfobacillus acetoxydans]CEJ06539.1 Sensor histidine kinase ResE [Acididesulfobacillus acetoxydans]
MLKKRIVFKLIAGFALIVLVSMLSIGTFFIFMFRGYTFHTGQTTLLNRAHIIANLLSENQNNVGPLRGYGFIRFLDAMTEAKVWITDGHGHPASLSGPGWGTGVGLGMGGGWGKGISPGNPVNSGPLPDSAQQVIPLVLTGKDSVSEGFNPLYHESTLTAGVPILGPNNQVIGTVLLLAPVTGITATVNKAIGILAVSLLVALIPAFGLGIYYAVQFARPLRAMNRTALEMARGNYAARTGINRQDEIGQLGNSLDLLAEKLSCTIDELFLEKGKIADIIASISEGIVAFDLDLKPLNVNSALPDIMHRPHPYPLREIEHDLAGLGIMAELQMAMRDKKVVQITKDWLDRKLKFVLSPIIDKNGNVSGGVALVQDISESERLEELRKDFIANVSHEFRTPLTVIKASLEAIVDGTINRPDAIERCYERMVGETRGLERLVTDLLDLSRLQSGKLSLSKEPVHLPTLLADTVKSLQTIADKKGVHINYDPPPSVPPLAGDYDRLRQLFVIFLDNAIKYSPAQTVVSVEVTQGKTLDVFIRDQGCGIAPETLPYIWDRFYKADKSRRSSGTGLGLAIAKHLVELHKGRVSLQSELGKGTVVKISLPCS